MRKKLTLEIVKERLEEINPNIEILSDRYTNNKSKLKCKCLIDGYEWETSWGSLRQGSGCHKCAGKRVGSSLRLNIDEVKKRLMDINPNIQILSDNYVNAHSKLKCKCLIDGYEWDVNWCNLSQGSGCYECAKKGWGNNIKFTISEIKEKLKSINPNIIILSQDYINCHSKLKCKCLIDNHEWEVRWSNLQKGGGCPKCGRVKAADTQKLDTKTIKQTLREINPAIEILSKNYINAQEKLHCKCLVDGYEWHPTWGNLSRGQGCPECGIKSMADSNRFTIDEIKEKIKEVNASVEILSCEYINARSKLECRCLIDGHKFKVTWGSLLSGSGCPKCNFSKGEKTTFESLRRRHVKLQEQYKFEDCKFKKPLPFDFAIFDNNNNLISLIEYDGEQHFKPVNFGGVTNERAFKNHQATKQRDQIKNTYCKENNIPLLRIPYWEKDNIESILDQWLIEIGLTETNVVQMPYIGEKVKEESNKKSA